MDFVGILCGVDYQCQSVSAVSVEGALTISGTHGGALFGDAAKVSYTDCTTDVTVNGTLFLSGEANGGNMRIYSL